nr:membrane protein UL45 [Psittacid alphaherpesvirus 6]
MNRTANVELLDDDRAGKGSRLRLLNERDVTVDEEISEDVHTDRLRPYGAPSCTVTCCGFLTGALAMAVISTIVLFVVIVFGISYTGFDNGICDRTEIGIGRVCVSCPTKNAAPEEAAGLCHDVGAEPAGFGVIKHLIDRIGTFTPTGTEDFIAVARMSESTTTCVRATSSGAASVNCPARAAVLCQRPRPLGFLQESIRRTRISMGVEKTDFYTKHAIMFADSEYALQK